MLANLLFTVICLGLVLLVSADLHGSAREPRRVRVRRDDSRTGGRN